MITNEVQRRSTEAHLHRFEEALANLEAKSGATKRSKLAQLEIDAVASQAEDLRTELEEYDRLRSGAVSTFEASSLEELSTLLIKARIARGWSQHQLADVLGVAEQQVQRYEATGYRSASLARICDISAALNVTITERLSLRGPDAA
ncbi:MAG TPA: helix-turn-helix transcriptional regulator [Acidimicrobiales bacterium]|nr:helix-turn-helix transcriptional regulator [Acidimicrobiales bacterium]